MQNPTYMNANNNKKLILSLINDDLRHNKLVNGLIEVGLDPKDYFLNLGDTIFNLMGFEDNKKTEEIFERYLEITKRAKYVDISQSPMPLNDLASLIYFELMSKKSI
jgi:Tat protein secretion system quality control protein TatD with DNase activity